MSKKHEELMEQIVYSVCITLSDMYEQLSDDRKELFDRMDTVALCEDIEELIRNIQKTSARRKDGRKQR